MPRSILSVLAAYISTSLDELPFLYLLFIQQKRWSRTVALAYFAGSMALVIAAMTAAFLLLQIPRKDVIGLLGLIPLVLGLKIAVRGEDDEAEVETRERTLLRNAWLFSGIFLLTLSFGGDDLAVYIPLFSTMTPVQLLTSGLALALITVFWILIAVSLKKVKLLNELIERVERPLTALLLIALGVYILIENGTIGAVVRLIRE